MDALALLCTLHADGPRTLERLRGAGCAGLGGIEALGAEELGRILDVPPAAARRFVREARYLAQRLEAPEGEDTAAISDAFRARHGSGAARSAEASRAMNPSRARRPSSGRELVERVLDTWRREEPPDAAAAPNSLARGQQQAASRTARVPEAPLACPPTLAPHQLDGLDEATCAVLAAAGVREISDLAATEPLHLARATGLAYTRLARLCFLARRSQESTPARRSLPGSAAEPLRPYRSGTPDRSDTPDKPAPQPAASSPEEVGGPFA